MTPAETLIERIRPGSPLRENVKHLFGLSSRLAAERRKLESDQSLSAVGRREKEVKFAKELVRNLAELSRPLRRSREDAAARRSNFKLPETDKTDAVSELRRQELRAFLRNLPLGARVAALDTLGDDGVLAVLDAPPALSGIPADRHEFIRTRYLEEKFGPQLRALESVDEDNAALESAVTMVRRDLQIGSGLANAEFESLLRAHEVAPG